MVYEIFLLGLFWLCVFIPIGYLVHALYLRYKFKRQLWYKKLVPYDNRVSTVEYYKIEINVSLNHIKYITLTDKDGNREEYKYFSDKDTLFEYYFEDCDMYITSEFRDTLLQTNVFTPKQFFLCDDIVKEEYYKNKESKISQFYDFLISTRKWYGEVLSFDVSEEDNRHIGYVNSISDNVKSRIDLFSIYYCRVENKYILELQKVQYNNTNIINELQVKYDDINVVTCQEILGIIEENVIKNVFSEHLPWFYLCLREEHPKDIYNYSNYLSFDGVSVKYVFVITKESSDQEITYVFTIVEPNREGVLFKFSISYRKLYSSNRIQFLEDKNIYSYNEVKLEIGDLIESQMYNS